MKLDSLQLDISTVESVVLSPCIFLILVLNLQFWHSPSPNTSIRTRTHEPGIAINPGDSIDTTGVCILRSVSPQAPSVTD